MLRPRNLRISLILSTWLITGCVSGGRNWWTGRGQEGSWGVELIVAGRALPVFEQRGQSWVEGRWSERYTLRVHNRTAQRIEAVVAVDGRDVIDGRQADADKRGYIIGPWSWVDIDGWRTSLDDVAAFRFTDPRDAHATRMGDANQLGVIQVLIFEEQAPEPVEHPPLVMAQQPSADRSARAEEAAPAGLGTGFGERRQSAAVETVFERGSSRPTARLQLRYDDAAGLCRAGLTGLCREQPRPLEPIESRPIESRPNDGFSEPPPGWDGHRF